MKTIKELIQDSRIVIHVLGDDGGRAFARDFDGRFMNIVFSWGGGWDHVSISCRSRCPTWKEMHMVKNIFFYDTECVIQYHPPEGDYVNIHPFVLHLWRPQDQNIPMPPKWMV